MIEEFKKLLKELEPEIGQYKEIRAEINEVYPSKVDYGSFQESVVWVHLEDNTYIRLIQTFDKWGELITSVDKVEIRDSDIWSGNELDLTADFEERFDELELNIEELADSIYSLTHLFVYRDIDLTNVTKEDTKYLEEILEQIKDK